MNSQQITFHLAREKDVAEINQLLQQNSAVLQGTFSEESVRVLLSERGAWVLLARQEERLEGVLFTHAHAANAPEIITGMLNAWPPGKYCWIYGPVCIATHARGNGLLEALFARACRHYGTRNPVLFINHDNHASFKAHIRIGLQPVAHFSHESKRFAVLSLVKNPSTEKAPPGE